MKKIPSNRKPKPYPTNDLVSQVSEPDIVMPSINRLPAALADFSYSKFKKIADKIMFSQAEWASILHLSERTLQRYSKDNKNFEGIYVDRILQIEKLIDTGLETFETAEAFYNWLKTPKDVLGSHLTFESLYHSQGITELYQQLERIQHGVYT